MTSSPTTMHLEAAEAPSCVGRQAAEAREALLSIGAALRKLDPPFVATIARGSSDHAATYGKYLIETATGVPVTSYAPSVSSVYEARSSMEQAACIAISQSGRSPDLVSSLHNARQCTLPLPVAVDARFRTMPVNAQCLLLPLPVNARCLLLPLLLSSWSVAF